MTRDDINERRTDEEQRDRTGTTLDTNRRTFMKTVGATVGAGLLGSAMDRAEASGVDKLTSRSDATAIATTSGRWQDPSTWESGSLPGDDATVWIDEGVTVTVDHQDDARLYWVFVAGELRFDPNTDSALNLDSLFTGSDSRLEIGTADNPVSPTNTVEITFIDRGPIDESWDPTRKSRGLLPMGDVEIHGAEKTPHTTLATHPTAGDSSLTLPEVPTNWQVGDSLVVPGMSAAENQDEEVTIASVDGSTIGLDETLSYDHVPPAGDLDSYVLNLTRNVRFQSESTEIKRRGHGMIMGTGSTINYAGLYEMGRTDKSIPVSDPPYKVSEVRKGQFDMEPNENRNARYALHYHRTGPRRSVEPHEATGCVVAPRLDDSGWKGSPGWGFTNHQSYAHVRDSITYKVYGTGFMTETGVEIGSFENNFALRSTGTGKNPDWREVIAWADHDHRALIDDFGHGGHGFWLQGSTVTVKDNVAAGHRNFGFAYWTRALGDYLPEEVTEPPVPPSELDREITEDDLGRHRGEIPNVPASYADHKPTPEHNVAPESDGPNVAEFAFKTFETEDGEVFVDAGSIPIHNENSTVFASGAGLDILNPTRGVLEQLPGEHDYYNLIEDFTAFNIGNRAGEDSLPFFEMRKDNGNLSFEFPRGVNIGIVMRYASYLRITNPRLVGVGKGTAIVHNMRAEDMIIENPDIENWANGIGALSDGLTEIHNPTFSDIEHGEINIQGEQLVAGEPTVKMWDVDTEDTIYMNDVAVGAGWNREWWLDDRQVFFDRHAPGEAVDDPRLDGGKIMPAGDETPPGTPANLQSTGHDKTSVDLSWDGVTDSGGSGLDHYVVAANGEELADVPAGTTSTTISDLARGTTYEFTVSAVDDVGNESPRSNPISVTTDGEPDTEAPDAPTNLTAAGTDTASVSLEWDAATDNGWSGVDHYVVIVDGEDRTTTAGTATTVEGLSASTSYEFAVAAVDGAQNRSPPSDSITVETGQGKQIGGEDWSATLTEPSDSELSIAFTSDPAAGWVDIHYTVADSDQLNVRMTEQDGTHTYVIDSVSKGDIVEFSFTYMQDLAHTTETDTYEFGTDPEPTDTTPPTAPPNLEVADRTSSSATLAWEPSSDTGGSGLDHYDVYLDGSQVREVAAGTTEATLSDLSAGTEYAVSVTATDGAGNESDASEIAATIPDPVTLEPPANLAATSVGETTVDVAWDASPTPDLVARYDVYVDGSKATEVFAGTTEATIPDLAAGTTYEITVRAIGNGGETSAPTDAITVTTTEGDPVVPNLSVAFPNGHTVGVGGTVEAEIRLSAAPSGLGSFDVDVSLADPSVATIRNASVDSAFGQGSASVSADGSAAELMATDTAAEFEDGATDVVLGRIRFGPDEGGETAVTLSIDGIDDDDGTAMEPTTEQGVLRVAPLEAVGNNAVPTDPDGDGIYEDINGNGRLDGNDIVVFFEHRGDSAIQNHTSAFDFNGNNRIDFADITTLFDRL